MCSMAFANASGDGVGFPFTFAFRIHATGSGSGTAYRGLVFRNGSGCRGLFQSYANGLMSCSFTYELTLPFAGNS